MTNVAKVPTADGILCVFTEVWKDTNGMKWCDLPWCVRVGFMNEAGTFFKTDKESDDQYAQKSGNRK